MELKIHDKPLFVEELVFQVNLDMIDKYLELDYEIWCKGLETRKGFLGSEIWISENNPGEVTSIIYWDEYESFKNIDSEWLTERKILMNELMGEENCKFVRANHDIVKNYKYREYK